MINIKNINNLLFKPIFINVLLINNTFEIVSILLLQIIFAKKKILINYFLFFICFNKYLQFNWILFKLVLINNASESSLIPLKPIPFSKN